VGQGKKCCDCIIFRVDFDGKHPIMFAVEVKKQNYHLDYIQAKLQNCIEYMINLIPNPKRHVKVVAILCAKGHPSIAKRAIFNYRIRIFGEKRLIALISYGQNINTYC
jgi:hypothetical protein